MSEASVVDTPPALESKAPANVQAAAREQGWTPPERFSGPADKFLDADAYLEKVEHVMPLLAASKRRLENDLAATKAQLRQQGEAVAQLQHAGMAAEARHLAERAATVEAARSEIKAQIRAASEAGDHALVADLLGQQTELVAEAREIAATPPPKPPAQQRPLPQVPADVVAWADANPWYTTDHRRTGLFNGIMADLISQGAPGGVATFEKAAAQMEQTLNPAANRRPVGDDKTSGGRPSGGARAEGYAALPAEARQVCDNMSHKFVGKGKLHETVAAWQASYATQYHKAAARERARGSE